MTKLYGEIYRKQGRFVYARVGRKQFMRVMENARKKTGGRISSISGRDAGKSMEILYTFITGEHVVNIKVEVDRRKPVIESVSKLFPAASLYERETYEMLGVLFEGNEELENILLDSKLSPRFPLRKEDKHGKG